MPEPRKPTVRVNDFSRVQSFMGSLYTFAYQGERSNDPAPVIILCTRGGSVTFYLENSRLNEIYFGGINVMYLDDQVRKLLVSRYGNTFPVDYKTIIKEFPSAGTAYRLYKVMGATNLTIVNPDIYLRSIR